MASPTSDRSGTKPSPATLSDSGSAVSEARGSERATQAAQRTAILVLGMHRSGSSAAARLVSILGEGLAENETALPATANEPSQPDSAAVCALDDDLLESAGSSWDDWRRFNTDWFRSPVEEEFTERALGLLNRDLRQATFFALEDPRICRLVPFWRDVLGAFGAQVKYVLPVRNPLAVAASLRESDGLSLPKSAMLWLRHVLDAEAATQELPRAFVAYDELLADWRSVARKLSESLDLAAPSLSASLEAEMDGLVAARHRHHRVCAERLAGHPELADWVQTTYDALLELCHRSDARGPKEGLVDVKAEFDRACKNLGALVQAEELDRELAEREASTLTERTGELESQLGEQSDRIQSLQTTCDELHRAVQDAEDKLHSVAHEANALRKSIALSEQRSERLNKHLSRLVKRSNKSLKKIHQLASSAEQSPGWKLKALSRDLYRFVLRRRPFKNSLLEKIRTEALEVNSNLQVEPIPMPAPIGETVAPRFRDYGDFMAWAHLARMTEDDSQEVKRVLGFLDRAPDYLPELQSKPLISIVMPSFNHEDCLPRALKSAIGQTYENWELLVVDRGSTDSTTQIVRRYNEPRIKLVQLDEEAGVAAARNRALNESSGDFIAYLDPVNIVLPRFLETAVRFLAANGEVDAVFCAQDIVSDIEGELQHEELVFGPFNRSLIENRNYIDLDTFLHRRSLYERLGGFDAKIRHFIDWELILRYTEAKPAVPLPVVGSRKSYNAAGNQATNAEERGAAMDVVRCRLQQVPIRLDPEIPLLDNEDGVLSDGVVVATGNPLWALPAAAIRTADNLNERKVAVVIPSFEALPYLRIAIDSIVSYSPKDVRIIVVDNGSSAPVREYLASEERCEVVQNSEDLGFHRAVNQGIELAGDHDVILFENDAVATPGWLHGLWEVLDNRSDVGLVVPRQVLPSQTTTLKSHVPIGNPEFECDVNLSVHHGNVIDPQLDRVRGYVELSFAPFFCVYIPRQTLALTGPLGESTGLHHRSERIYCDVVRQMFGLKVVYTPYAKVYHFLHE